MIFFMQFGSLQSVQFSVLVLIAKWVLFKSSLNKNSFNIPWLHGNPFSWSRARVQGPSLTFAQVVWVVASALTPPARREGRAGVKQCNVDECFPSWEELGAALSCMTNVPRWPHAVTQCTAKLPFAALQCCKMPCQSIPSQSAAVLILQMKLNAECIQNFPNQYPHLFQWTLHWCSKWPKLIICCCWSCCCVEVGGGGWRDEAGARRVQCPGVERVECRHRQCCCSHLPPATSQPSLLSTWSSPNTNKVTSRSVQRLHPDSFQYPIKGLALH